VYRDVGSEQHGPADPEFVDLLEIPFEADAALLLCSDGLSDLVDSASIARIVREFAGDPDSVVRELIEAANAAGGKDNITVVYVEGERFAASPLSRRRSSRVTDEDTARLPAAQRTSKRAVVTRLTIIVLVAGLIVFILYRRQIPLPTLTSLHLGSLLGSTDVRVVQPGESIATAIERAGRGARIIVEPGEYRERIVLRDDVSVVSRVPRAATIRLPSAAADDQAGPAVVAAGVSGADLIGFRIVGDSATPLGTGILITDSALSIIDVEISGAAIAGVVFAGADRPSMLTGSEVHDNPGAGLVIDAGAAPRIVHNVFYRNGTSEHGPGPLNIQKGARPTFQRNTFLGTVPHIFDGLSEETRQALTLENWFLPLPGSTAPPSGGPHQGRR